MTSNLDLLDWLLDKTRSFGADAADAVMFETTDISCSRRMGKPEGLERSENEAIGLRGWCGKSQAIVSSTDFSKDALQELAERCVAMAKITPPDPDSALASEQEFATQFADLDLCDNQEPSSEWMVAQCAEAEEAALAVKGITNSEGADVNYSNSKVHLAIDNGTSRFNQLYPASHFSLSVSVLAGTGVDMQRDYDYSTTRHKADLGNGSAIGKEAAERTLKRLHPRKIPSSQQPIIFDPRVSRQLLSVFAGAISGSAIARGSSFLKDDMGKAIFSNQVTIIDDPHRVRGLGSRPFDAEGVANHKHTLVEHGELKSWLLDIRTGNKLGLKTTGHASRGLASPPSPSTTNLYMENGSISPDELIRSVGTGLYVTETFGMGINSVTGDYSQGVSGFWIENGELAYPVSEITIAGHLKAMFSHLVVANDLVFRYATNAPTVCIESMTIAGT
ncbi:MAG: metallopeptidase TldD-related protein [Rickettsiales bacterium]|nr:metallopeptidase TldD-related protein [Rickettsiales bacterium]